MAQKKQIGFLGFGKIGKVIATEIGKIEGAEISFLQDPFLKESDLAPVISGYDEALYSKTDLVIECATADVLKSQIENILKGSDLLMFSVTAFSDPHFEEEIHRLTAKYGTHVYLPHGAILGLDGIFDGRSLIHSVSIETTKNPASLGRTDTERTVLYEGSTRQACRLYPRNVNVHAEIALAGIGFERTQSRIVADPAVNTNTHVITIDGEGIHFQITVSSFSTGGVTGAYTPVSACGSLRRLLGSDGAYSFV